MATSRTFYSNKIKSKRNQLKKDRTLRTLQAIVRGLLVISLAGGSFWLLTLPNWVIRNREQIKVKGNELLSPEEVRDLVSLPYPQSLLKLSTQDLVREIKQKIPLSKIIVTKEFIPPSLNIEIKELAPVAIAYQRELSPDHRKLVDKQIGYIDQQGIFVEAKHYQNLRQRPEKAPQLKIVGVREFYLPYWQELYHFITQSEVKINLVDWHNPTNLILITELGKVYIGAYSSQLPKQLALLAKLKPLTSKIPREQISYIDISDPEMPLIREKL